MKKKAQKKYEQQFLESQASSTPFPFDYEGVMKAKSINELEDAYIAPIYGFKNYLDYYEQNACGNYVDGISVPVLAINAKDDPFFHPEMSIPNVSPNPLRFCNPDYGGHCGFMFHQEDNHSSSSSVSWVSRELSRFVNHVDDNVNANGTHEKQFVSVA